jgi:hypothetical protein
MTRVTDTAKTSRPLKKARVAIAASALLALALGLMPPVGKAEAADNSPATLAFIDKAFTGNEIVLYGSPEYGVSLEALLARKAGGYRLTQQLADVKHLLADRAVVSYNKSGYLHTKDGQLRTGRAGLFLFTSVALGVANRPLQLVVFNQLKAAIAADGSVPLANGNGVEYAWVVLGLQAFNQTVLAAKVLAFAESKSNADGGFAGWSSASSTDATGLMLQAEATLKSVGGARIVAARKSKVAKAVAFLTNSAVDKNHWLSDNGDGTSSIDVNGTAYAAMGLQAAGAPLIGVRGWLKAQLAADGGIRSAWSGTTGDVFATAQGYAPLIGKTYLQLLPKK